MMFEAMIMDLVLFFAGLFAVLAVAFVGLCAVGVSPERIGQWVARFARRVGRAPWVRRLAGFSRRHRKAVAWSGAVLALCFIPFALAGAVVVVGSVAAFYAFGDLSQFVEVKDKKYSGLTFYDNETAEERSRRWTDEELGLYDG